MTVDMVNSPPHYTAGKYETIDIIEDANWGYRLATAFKYLHRCEYKGKKKEDLRKAIWFILREIDSIPEEVVYDFIPDWCTCDYELSTDGITCSTCNRPFSRPTKTAIGSNGDSDNPYMPSDTLRGSVTASKLNTPPGKVIPPILSKDALGGHTEPLNSGLTEIPPNTYVSPGAKYAEHTETQNTEMDRREEYRALTRTVHYGTHKPNTDQVVMQELTHYD